MEKLSIIWIYLMGLLILSVVLTQLVRSKKKHIAELKAMSILGIAMNALYIMSLFMQEEKTLSVFYTTVLIVEGWILFLFLRYTHSKNGKVDEKRKSVGVMCFVVLGVDNFLLLYNTFTHHLFDFEIAKMGESIYVRAEWTPFFIAHYTLYVFVGILIMVLMFDKAKKVAHIYRPRYLIGAWSFVIGISIEIVGRIIDNINMWSVLIYTIGIFAYFLVYFLFPKSRVERMKTYAINNMQDPVLMFDYNNHLQVFNEAAEKRLRVSADYSLEQFIDVNELYYNFEDRATTTNKDREFTRTKILEGRTYLIHGHELWDHKERFVGTLIVYTDITNQEQLKNEATLYATRDQLTGLWNRDYFYEMVAKTIHENPEEEFIMIVSDIYHFKMFNEILGSNIGDELLMAIAQAYREICKRLWIFSRVSGDKYALLMPKADFNEKRFMEYVKNTFRRRSYELQVHCYVGVYEITDRNMSVESMYNRAYMALESMKGDLQKEIAYYHEEIRNKRIFETTTLDELDRALLNNEFEIYLQPQLDIKNNKVVSAEALIRWNKPGRGIISPGEFIPIFESNGMIAKLDYHVWELACRQLHIWKNEGYGERSVSVNISAKDFYLADLYESITGLVERYKIAPKNLKLEITETAFVLDVKKQMELVKRLQDYGFIIEIDDFGSGYSSLNSLKDISVDILKMDMKFFEKGSDSSRAEKIVRSVVTLANQLGMPVIAEGVETEEDLNMLKGIGCQMIQGYYFSKPLSVPDYEAFLTKHAYGDMEHIIKDVKENECV